MKTRIGVIVLLCVCAVSSFALDKDAVASALTDIDGTRSKLSAVGIGPLEKWMDDEMGGFMSVSPFYEFGAGAPSNNIGYCLLSEESTRIQQIMIVLSLNNGDRDEALKMFSDIIAKTYRALGFALDGAVSSAASAGHSYSRQDNGCSETIALRDFKPTPVEKYMFVLELSDM